jgi:uncharacterized protein (DUF305 family)
MVLGPARRALIPLVAAGIFWTAGAPAAQHPTRTKEELKLMKAPGIDQAFNLADVDFMQGMIPHHAQAVKMAKMAATQAESRLIKNMCERIVVGQGYEITMMRQWLADRGQDVPAADAMRHTMKHGGMVHEMLMPGMLTDEEMAALSKARGKEWDRLFLIGMIKHHQGAIDMVDVLFKSWGAAQGDDIYKFASDVYADQTTEIEVMKQLLAEIK